VYGTSAAFKLISDIADYARNMKKNIFQTNAQERKNTKTLGQIWIWIKI
jgi:hypothetical protein